ncbi:hypothetical protein SAMN04488096_1126 [Mesonia phycicola]|uniref:Uncharacterized protein n=1 Tax=Mesonia phycicola TaxID=579105 RepID=A0A1M6HIQ0_9FLAO|nr:hypothetical protein [Mesonia phycicola]SHJ22063.1 hypothetical protein SAMN04488096_1126 [Mesonia phycicola]
MEGIREFEKNILIEVGFVEKVTKIREQFLKNNSDEILKCDKKTFMAMVDPKYNLEHKGGGVFTLTKTFKNFTFILEPNKYSGAGLLFYIIILKDGIDQDIGFSQYGSVLRYLPYDKSRIEKTNRTFGYNALSEMKDYLNQMITLWEEFVEKYIEKLELGIEPPNTPYED